jgi:hypothetical protein
MIVDVHCEDDTVQIARIVDEHSDSYSITFLESKKHGVYNFSSETELVPKESISGFYDVDNLEDTDLYMKVQGGYVLMDDSEDEDYVCSDSDVSESESESLCEEGTDEEEA